MKTIWIWLILTATQPLVGGLYIGAHGGANLVNVKNLDDLKIEMKKGAIVGASLGYRSQGLISFRAEAEVSYRRNHVDGSSDTLNSITYMGNGYLGFNVARYIFPYAGAGIGYLHRGDSTISSNDDSFTMKIKSDTIAFQTMAGLTLAISNHLDLNVECRHCQAENSINEQTFVIGLNRFF